MSCWHGYTPVEGNESAFAVDASAITFGAGAIAECGAQLRALGATRVAVFTDANVAKLEAVAIAQRALRDAGIDAATFDHVRVEPTDASFLDAAAFAKSGHFDGYLSIGGGSAIDTCKAAMLYATYPADLLAYVNAPIGEGRAVPGPLPPHVACPTTSGTGSECTGIAVFDYLALKAKTGIASRRLRPTLALIDPTITRSLPSMVVAASGFDVLCHALESYTARPYVARAKPQSPTARPMSQGRNPWSDLGSLEALRIGGKYLVRAVRDANDLEAREAMSWAATLAGIAFGNSGVHLPHAMSYAIAGLVRDYRCPGYPDHEPMVPHGVSVVVNAPSVFRATASTEPARHRQAAEALGADLRGVGDSETGEALASALIDLMKKTSTPNGASGVGYHDTDVDALARGAIVQKRLVDNAPMAVDEAAMQSLFRGGMRYW